MSGHGYAFDRMVREAGDDEDYAADVRAERKPIIRAACPNPSCMDGKVEVRDVSAFPALAICGVCIGLGYIVTEAQS